MLIPRISQICFGCFPTSLCFCSSDLCVHRWERSSTDHCAMASLRPRSLQCCLDVPMESRRSRCGSQMMTVELFVLLQQKRWNTTFYRSDMIWYYNNMTIYTVVSHEKKKKQNDIHRKSGEKSAFCSKGVWHWCLQTPPRTLGRLWGHSKDVNNNSVTKTSQFSLKWTIWSLLLTDNFYVGSWKCFFLLIISFVGALPLFIAFWLGCIHELSFLTNWFICLYCISPFCLHEGLLWAVHRFWHDGVTYSSGLKHHVSENLVVGIM